MVMESSSYIFAQWLFLKFLALNYFFAFGSLFFQIKGLYGREGILPIRDLLRNIEKKEGRKLYFRIPTLFWWASSDETLQHLTVLGMIASILVLIGAFPAPLFLFLWLAYLSFVSVGASFLAFQWDILLLEVGFISIFFSLQSPPPFSLVLLYWVLLFRLIFSAGVIKLLSRCPEWRGLTAMEVHYESQPIPNRIAYYFHQQPKWFAKLSCIVVFFLEIAVPFLFLTTSYGRLLAFLMTLFLQLMIMISGNYAFFNTLTMALCIPLLDDKYLSWMFDGAPAISALFPHIFSGIVLNAVAAVLILLNVLELVHLFVRIPRFEKIRFMISPYYLINPYGLFARMTTTRNEIIIQGSNDGEVWKDYEFHWKPGDVKAPPRQVAPHQPRLDWQMWFASLSSYQNNPWFIRLLTCLLQGSHSVLALFKKNPFPEAPPKFIRTLMYEYHFTDIKTKRATGDWWKRTLKGIYSPSCSLQNPEKTADSDSFTSF